MNELESLLNAIKGLADIDDSLLTDEMMATITAGIDQQFAPELVEQSINQIVKNLEDQRLTKKEAKDAMDAVAATMKDMIYTQNPYEGNKKVLVDTVMDKMFAIFNAAAEKYHSYSIELPIKLEDGAQVPTYAHDTDAAADLYALEDTDLPYNSRGNKVRTGVSIQLPEGWLALIIPRSSIGAKTPLRLSNSVGLIDSGYRGELGVLYDNLADQPYHITKGDRIAQLLVMPSYRFQAKVVESLEDSDRGEGGFGSTGA